MIRIRAVNTPEVVRRLNVAAQRSHKVMRNEMMRFAKTTILREALLEVPYKTGALASTGDVRLHHVGTRHSRIIISFGLKAPTQGNKVVNYALIQHENKTFSHSPGRKFKYLTDPGDRNVPLAKKAMAQSMHSVTAGAYGTLGRVGTLGRRGTVLSGRTGT